MWRKVELTIVTVAMLTAGISFVGIETAAAGVTRAADPCASVDDQTSDATLKECGMTALPLVEKRVLEDGPAAGATEYSYDVGNGELATTLRPPPGFNFQTASAKQRAAYGLPDEPQDKTSSEHRDWEEMLAKIHPLPVNDRMLELNITASPCPLSSPFSCSPNWSGIQTPYAAPTSSVGALYTEPTVNLSSCLGRQQSISTWVGLGGQSAGAPLAQNGTLTDINDNGSIATNHRWWYEFLPDLPGVVSPPSNGQSLAGHAVAVQTSYTGTPNRYQFFWYDYTTGGYDVVQQTFLQMASYGAETITAERGAKSYYGSGTYATDMANYGGLSVASSNINGVTNAWTTFVDMRNDAAYQYPYTPVTDNFLSSVASYNPSNGALSSVWNNCY